MSPRVLHVMESWKSYCSVTLSALLVESATVTMDVTYTGDLLDFFTILFCWGGDEDEGG